jgi:hypothetical protein
MRPLAAAQGSGPVASDEIYFCAGARSAMAGKEEGSAMAAPDAQR